MKRVMFMMVCSAALCGMLTAQAQTKTPGVVSFKDADKIKSWDAWDDHKKKKVVKTIFEKEKPCVTWQRLCRLKSGLPPAGQLETRLARDIKGSKWSIGCETMDRDYADWNAYKDYLSHLGAKRGRLFSGWAKTEQEKGKYDFTWLDPQVREMAAMGVKPWICLSYGNPVWGSDFRLGMRVKQVTGNKEAFEAWLRYVTACVERYKDVVDEWEIWNEPFGQAYEYAEMFYRTAKAIRAVQPTAKCYVTAIIWDLGKDPSKSAVGILLERLKKENALDLASYFLYHPYHANPDISYERLAEPLRAFVKTYSPKFDIYQGEVGCPSQLEYAHALDRIEWTEYAQAKWLLRRTMGDAVRDIPSSIFTCVDLRYTFMLQSFGLLRCNLLKEVVYRRPSFYAMQHVFSYFDEEVRPVGVTTQTVNKKPLTVATFARQSTPVTVLWFSGAQPGNAVAYEKGDVILNGQLPQNLVWVDLLTGKVCTLPEENLVREENRTILKKIPLWDSPVMIAADNQVPRKELNN